MTFQIFHDIYESWITIFTSADADARADLGVSWGDTGHPFFFETQKNKKYLDMADYCPGHPFLNFLDPSLQLGTLNYLLPRGFLKQSESHQIKHNF